MSTHSEKKPSLLQVIGSVLAAFVGVQSDKNRSRDFKHGTFSHYVIIGLIATAVFIAVIWTIVKLVLSAAGI